MLGYLSTDMICSEMLGEDCELRGIDNIEEHPYIYKHIFPPNGCHCVYRSPSVFGTRRKIVYGFNVSFVGYCFLFNFL